MNWCLQKEQQKFKTRCVLIDQCEDQCSNEYGSNILLSGHDQINIYEYYLQTHLPPQLLTDYYQDFDS